MDNKGYDIMKKLQVNCNLKYYTCTLSVGCLAQVIKSAILNL